MVEVVQYYAVMHCTLASSVGADTGKKRLLRHFVYKNSSSTTNLSLHCISCC